jgi:hypothetical protein
MAETNRKKKPAQPPPPKPAGTRQSKKKPSTAKAGGVRLWKSEISCPRTTLGKPSPIAKTSVINDSGSAIEIERIVDETGMFPEELELYGFAENTPVQAGGRLVLDFAYLPKRTGEYEAKLQIHIAGGEVLDLTVKASAYEIWKPTSKQGDGWTGAPEGPGRLGFSGPGGGRHLSFGSVKVGASSRPRAITVKNLGKEPLTLTGFVADEDLSVTFRGPVESPTLEPGKSVVADAIYTPKKPGLHVSHLFGLTSLGRPEGHLEVHGSARSAKPPPKRSAKPAKRGEPAPAQKVPVKPVLSTAVEELEISSTAGGAIGSAAFMVRVDRGEGPIYFHARDGFSVKEPKNGVGVKAGETLRVEVRYLARSVGTKQSRLIIQPTFGPSLIVRLRGHGTKLDMEARIPKARVPVLRRPPEPTEDAKKKLEEVGEVPEKDRVKDGEKRKVRVDESGVTVDLKAEWKDMLVEVRRIGARQQTAIDGMRSRLKGKPVDWRQVGKAADDALVFAAGAIAELAATTLRQFVPKASMGATLLGTVVVAGIKDVIKARVKQKAPPPSRNGGIDSFIQRLKYRTSDLATDLEKKVNHFERRIFPHPAGPRIAVGLHHAFQLAAEAAAGQLVIEMAAQWASMLGGADRQPAPPSSQDAPSRRAGRPADEPGRSLAQGMIEIRVARPALPVGDIHVEAAGWHGMPREAADAISGENQAAVTLGRLRVPYRIVGEGGLLIERWPGEARPRIGLTSEYWLADYWGGRIEKPHLSRNNNSPNPRFVKLALERLIRQLDNETINGLGLTAVVPGEVIFE